MELIIINKRGFKTGLNETKSAFRMPNSPFERYKPTSRDDWILQLKDIPLDLIISHVTEYRVLKETKQELEWIIDDKTGQSYIHQMTLGPPFPIHQLLQVSSNDLFCYYLDLSINVFPLLPNPSDIVQLYAIEKNINCFKFINKPSDTVKEKAVSIDGMLISHIKKPSDLIQMKAVTQNPKCIGFIRRPCKAVQEKAIRIWPQARLLIKHCLL